MCYKRICDKHFMCHKDTIVSHKILLIDQKLYQISYLSSKVNKHEMDKTVSVVKNI